MRPLRAPVSDGGREVALSTRGRSRPGRTPRGAGDNRHPATGGVPGVCGPDLHARGGKGKGGASWRNLQEQQVPLALGTQGRCEREARGKVGRGRPVQGEN